MTNEDFGGKRIHSYDFEVYPETTDLGNPNATFDLYIGIAK
jgi:predicted transcriptional regulator YdeE